ncbi:hypothetical protein E4U12_006656 [Claviceps purpurea]|nr:hypothetical protein E4U28_000122 [Claviceps purpurea]KAG6140189.1 hypothetical protein E4U12_006656 [Claviceps purpurea]
MSSFVAKLVSGALPLFGGLTLEQTNGNWTSWQGLSGSAPPVPGIESNLKRAPAAYKGDTVYQATPYTGVTRKYHFDVTRTFLSPDGYRKPMIAINNQFPGPLIEANWGDWIEVSVTNSIQGPADGTAIHWHGLLQHETPWYDGVPGVSQCPIAPGSNFTYRFQADHVGTTFYHSHYSAQISAGAFGPMVFHGPKSQPYDIDLGPVLLNDYFHPSYETLVEGIMGVTGVNRKPAFSDNNLINGKMNYDCSLVKDGTPCVSNAGVSKFKFTPGKKHLLRIINGGSAGLQYFSVDEHEMEVISMDFVPIKPYKTKYITLGVGQRTEVIVRGKTDKKDTSRGYFLRANLSTICALPRQPRGLAAIYYSDADFRANKTPKSKAQVFSESRLGCANEALESTVPLHVSRVKTPDKVIHLQIEDSVNATGNEAYLINNQTFRINYNEPVIKLANQGNFSYPSNPEWNVVNTGNARVVRVIWENQKFDPKNPHLYNLTFAHPMHMHGHDWQVLASGFGAWDGKVTNAQNPLRRDTHILPPNGHLVMQFETDNPGIWPFHCHVAWHVSAGLLVNIMEQPLKLKARREIPGVMEKTCRDWNAWSSRNVVPQIDSGLRL